MIMAITAADVKKLREATDCGMMECKNALKEVDGDFDKAVDFLRKKGLSKAEKKSDRVAAEGMIQVKLSDDGQRAIMVEINSETDFVARDTNFVEFVEQVSKAALENEVSEVSMFETIQIDGDKTVEVARQELVGRIGENVKLRRVAYLSTTDGKIGSYVHSNKRIGVIVALKGGDDILAKDIAMHIAAAKPIVVSEEQVPSDVVAKEREIFTAQAIESGKPENIAQKMVEGRIRKFLAEVSLVGQPFVKDPNVTIAELLKKQNASVEEFVRFELGEGIEKKEEDFAKEVMSQVQGA